MTKPITITIPCHPCNGTGHRTLPDKYASTLNAFLKLKRAATCQSVHDALVKSGEIKSPTVKSLNIIYKRVARMEAWGVVKKVSRAKPANGDLRTASWKFQVVD